MARYTITLELPEIEADSPREAARRFVTLVENEAEVYIYLVEDEETGETIAVDLNR